MHFHKTGKRIVSVLFFFILFFFDVLWRSFIWNKTFGLLDPRTKISHQHLHCSNYSWSAWVTSKPMLWIWVEITHKMLSQEHIHTLTEWENKKEMEKKEFTIVFAPITCMSFVAFQKISMLWFHFENCYRYNHQWWCNIIWYRCIDLYRCSKKMCTRKNKSNNCNGSFLTLSLPHLNRLLYFEHTQTHTHRSLSSFHPFYQSPHTQTQNIECRKKMGEINTFRVNGCKEIPLLRLLLLFAFMLWFLLLKIKPLLPF